MTIEAAPDITIMHVSLGPSSWGERSQAAVRSGLGESGMLWLADMKKPIVEFRVLALRLSEL